MSNTATDSKNIKEPTLQEFTDGLSKACAFIKKDMAIAVSYKFQFVFQFTQVFFAVAIIYFIGKMLGESGGSSLLKAYGADYFSFALIVGIIAGTYSSMFVASALVVEWHRWSPEKVKKA